MKGPKNLKQTNKQNHPVTKGLFKVKRKEVLQVPNTKKTFKLGTDTMGVQKQKTTKTKHSGLIHPPHLRYLRLGGGVAII